MDSSKVVLLLVSFAGTDFPLRVLFLHQKDSFKFRNSQLDIKDDHESLPFTETVIVMKLNVLC